MFIFVIFVNVALAMFNHTYFTLCRFVHCICVKSITNSNVQSAVESQQLNHDLDYNVVAKPNTAFLKLKHILCRASVVPHPHSHS